MIVWSVIRKLDKEVQEQYPELTEKEQVALVWAAYAEIEREVLMGPSTPVGVVDIDFNNPLNELRVTSNAYSYPGVLSKYKAT